MRYLALLLLCIAFSGCTTHASRTHQVSEAASVVIKEERLVVPFEERLRALGARILTRGIPEVKEAVLPIDSFFRYREFWITYRVDANGEVTVIKTETVAVAHS